VIFSKVHGFVQNSFFSQRAARLVILALVAPLFTDFQQSAGVCAKERFKPDFSKFCPFRTGRTTF